jgi:hypothetical protein
MPGAKPGGPKPAAANGKAALNGKAVTNSKVVTTRKGAKDDATNGTPVAPVAAGPKVGAKPVNKKGGAAKRQPSS